MGGVQSKGGKGECSFLPLAADELGGVLEARGADVPAELFARLDRAREVHASIQTRRAAGRRERVDREIGARDSTDVSSASASS